MGVHMKGHEMTGHQLIFMISLPRSGSTMLQKILGSHTDIYTRSEPWLMLHPLHMLKSNGIEACYDAQLAKNGVQDFINNLPENGEKFYYKKMYGDKSVVWNSSNISYDEIIFSNVSSAIRKDILLENPFSENIMMSEDMEWAYRIIDKGYKILYQPLSIVNHSHNSSMVNVFKRYFDFGVSHSQIFNNKKKTQFLGKGLSVFLEEIKYLLSKREFKWVPRAIIYYLSKFVGLVMGRYQRFLPRGLKARFSNYRMYWK
jgi:rhamnosyltransferase